MRQSKVVRLRIAKIIKEAHFPHRTKNRVIELCLLRAIELKRSYEKPTVCSKTKPVGRPKSSPYVPILSAAIFRAWRIGTGKKAKVSKRFSGGLVNDFVKFATKIYWLEGITNVIDNLDAYRALGNKLERQAWVWRVTQK
jgi:hypothetical protein